MNPLNILFQCSFASSILLLLLLFSLSTSTSTTLTYDDCKSLTDDDELIYLPDSSSSSSNSSLTTKIDTIESEIIAAKFAYLMKLCVKTIGKRGYETTYAIPDTGSDFIWINSEKCEGEACHCDTTSSTAGPSLDGKCIQEDEKSLIKCDNHKYCDEEKFKELNIPRNCPSPTSQCKYKISYSDRFSTEGSFSMGNFKFVVDKNQKLSPYYNESIMFGVSKKSEGPLEKQSKGVVGLGLGSLSLIRQFSLVQKFSYCLQHPESKTKRKFSFGSAVKTDHDKFTHLLGKHEGGGVCEFRYCVHLSTISFNGGRHDNEIITVNEKNKVMVVDSGTTFTSLANGLFDEFLEKVKLAIGGDNEPIKINDHYNKCFVEESGKKLDKVTFGFGVGESKIDVELKRENFFDELTHDDGHGGGKRKYLCLTVENATAHNILGSRAQMDFLVAFDTTVKSKGGMKVSFEKDCGGKQINNGGEFEALL